MRRWNSSAWRRWMRGQRGSITLEFLGVGIVLLVPIAYGALTLAQVEQALLGTELAARNAARVLSADGTAGLPLAEQHITLALENHGLQPEHAEVTIRCAPNPDCAVAGEDVTVQIHYDLPLPLLSDATDLVRIPVEATRTFPQQRFGSPE